MAIHCDKCDEKLQVGPGLSLGRVKLFLSDKKTEQVLHDYILCNSCFSEIRLCCV